MKSSANKMMTHRVSDSIHRSRIGNARQLLSELHLARRWEAWHPVVFGLGFLWWAWGMPVSATQQAALYNHVLPIALTLASILAGFQATGHSVLLAIVGSSAWEHLQRLGLADQVVRFHWEAIRALMLFIALALVVLVAHALGHAHGAGWDQAPAVLGGVLVWAGAGSYRVVRLMVKLLRKKDLG